MELEEYLKSHNIWESFLQNCLKDTEYLGFRYCTRQKVRISTAFIFHRTSEGSQFWYNHAENGFAIDRNTLASILDSMRNLKRPSIFKKDTKCH